MNILISLFGNHKEKILNVDEVVNQSNVLRKNMNLSKQLQKSIKTVSKMKVQAERAKKHLDAAISIAIINGGGRID